MVVRVHQGRSLRSNRRRAAVFLVATVSACALIALSVLNGLRLTSERLRNDQAIALQTIANEQTAALEQYFERAREISLLVAQNPSFREYLSAPAFRDGVPATKHRELHAISDALAYIEELYPGQIGEACFIDGSGAEHARVVHGAHADTHELSTDESQNPFFGPTIRLGQGAVFQARPYVSPDTDEWVISNSTPVRAAGRQALVHFEVRLESFRTRLADLPEGVSVRIFDTVAGTAVLDSRAAILRSDSSPIADTTPLSAVLGGEPTDTVIARDGGLHYARRVTSRDGNDNHWTVVASNLSPAATGILDIGPGGLAVVVAALVLLASSLWGFAVSQRELRRLAATDGLTGLPNREVFLENLRSVLAGSRFGRAAVLMVDLNRFKEINDALGHHAGNVVLETVASRLRRSLRATDLVARLGGDEFAVVLSGAEAKDYEGAGARIVDIIEQPTQVDGVTLRIRASVGMSMWPDDGEDCDGLMRAADVAMYEAKRSGGGLVAFHPGLRVPGEDSLRLASEFRAALDEDQLVLEFQPKIDLVGGEVVGLEALVRWEHPGRGRLAPAAFVPMTEDLGLCRSLTAKVLTLALEQLATWQSMGLRIPVAVNLSARTVQNLETVEVIARGLRRWAVPADLLTVEITETSLIGDIARAREVLNAVCDLGVTISIDDYGTGYASLQYLQELPVREIKIDRRFIQGMSERNGREIVESTIDLGHRLGLVVVAEGVEDEATRGALIAAGCDQAQGFAIARPMSGEQVVRWLAAHGAPAARVGSFDER